MDPADSSPEPQASTSKHLENVNVSPETASVSPEAKCTICLEIPQVRAYADSCLHEFCYSCLLEWSKVKPRCPLCKRRFDSIIHNVRSDNEYDEYRVPTNVRRCRYRSTVTVAHRRQGTLQNWVQPFALGTDVIPAQNSSIPCNRQEPLSSQHRASVYEQNLWVRPSANLTGQYRECSPEFYRFNPAEVHRLVPWLNREIAALLPDISAQRSQLLDVIIEMLSHYPVRSLPFHTRVLPFLGGHTSHFIAELFEFARSPMNMTDFDHAAIYVRINVETVELDSSSESDTESSYSSEVTSSSSDNSLSVDGDDENGSRSESDNETGSCSDSDRNTVVLSPEPSTSRSISVPSSLITSVLTEHNYCNTFTPDNDSPDSPRASTSGAGNGGYSRVHPDGESSCSTNIVDLTGESIQGEMEVDEIDSDYCVIVGVGSRPEIITLDSDPEVVEEGEITISD